jgi:signal transduction histidine kinase
MKQLKVTQHYFGFFYENFMVNSDAKRLQQVFLNIISNAIKFTDRDGSIRIIIQKFDDSLRIAVADTGVGIKDEDQDKLFKLFGAVKEEKKKLNPNGIGLGLVISKLIVSQFNGKIDFISKFEFGSTFFYDFEIQKLAVKIRPERDF